MKYLFFIVFVLFSQIVAAQKTEEVRSISLDSLKKYKIGIVRDSTKVYVAKNGAVYSNDMSLWEKIKYFVKLVYDKYTILSWGLIIIVGFWLLGVIFKSFSKLSELF